MVLRVSEDITFDSAPTPQYLGVDTDGLIECIVSGNPEPEISWRHRGSRVELGLLYGQHIYRDSHTQTNKQYVMELCTDIDLS